MVDDLLAGARAQAERSEPSVRVAALLRIARVQTAFDLVQARLTFRQALDDTHRISGRDGEFLLEQARLLAAAVAPSFCARCRRLLMSPPVRVGPACALGAGASFGFHDHFAPDH